MSVDLVVCNGLLIDGTDREPVSGAGVVVRDGRIRQAGPDSSLQRDSDSRVIDVEGRTIMPGLVDSHTHLTYPADQLNLGLLETDCSLELNAIKAAGNAAAILAMGVTTIGDGGCRGYIGPAVRDAINQGVIPGPRVISAGPILCGTAGLADRLPNWMAFEDDIALGMVVDGPDEVRRAVRRQVKGGVDWVKVAASGVAGSRYIDAETQDLSAAEITAAVTEAAKFGRKVHAHAHSREAVKAAARAGVLSLHSGEYVDAEGLEVMREHGTIFSPTIAWLHARCLPGYPMAKDTSFVDEASRAFRAAADAVVRARELGVKLALGTDASHRFFHVPDAVLELEYLVGLGYPPLEAIGCATRVAAEAVGRSRVLGTLQSGKFADLLVVEGNPAEDIRVLRDKSRIHRMFVGGREVALAPDRGPVGMDFDPTPALRDALDPVS